MKHLPIQLTSCIFALVCLFAAVAPAHAKSESIWKLVQTSDFYGSQAMMWNDRAFRLELETSNLVAVAHAPQWEVTIFNGQTHKYYQDTFDQFCKKYANCCGQNVTRRYIPGKKPPQKLGEFLAKQYDVLISHPGRSHFRNGTESTEMWICPLPMPTQVRESLAMLTHVPLAMGVPITIYGDLHDSRRCSLRTASLRRTNVDASSFAVPPGMQRMDNELALLLDQDESSGAVFSDISYLQSKGSHDKKVGAIALSGACKR
jgi:hypothetical protein